MDTLIIEPRQNLNGGGGGIKRKLAFFSHTSTFKKEIYFQQPGVNFTPTHNHQERWLM
jgi:hypothetical protein